MTASYRGRTPELLEDLDWLLSFGTHPELAAKQLDTSIAAIEMHLRRAGRTADARPFNALMTEKKRRRQ